MVRRYDIWAGNPKGIPEDPTRCIQEVPDWSGWHVYQCFRKRKVGLYCTQHAKKRSDPNKGWDMENV
jgi:hypothetical protein